MTRKVLFLVDSDPRRSPRPAEAVRIAAGLAPWQKSDLSICLRDAAVLALAAETEELVEGESFARHLPILGASHRPVYVARGTAFLARIHNPPVPFQALSDSELAQLAGHCDCVIRF